MWQMVLAHISIQGWIVDPNVKSLFYCSSEVLVLPSHNVEILNTYVVTSGVKVVKYGEGGLKPLVGKSPHHIQNNQDFMEHLKGIKLGPDEVMMSYDVRAHFTSVPIQPALDVIEKLLKEDTGLQSRISMSTKHIMDLLEFCLRSTYFTFRR